MTRVRLAFLLGGIALLAGITYSRLKADPDAPPPSTTAALEHPADAPPKKEPLITFSGKVMGTTYTVTAQRPSGVSSEKLTSVVHAALLAVDARMSTYKPESELSQLNRLAKDQEVTLSPELTFVLSLSLDVTEKTSGAFDVTVGPLVSAYGFGVAPQAVPPAAAQLKALLAQVGSSHIHLNRESRKISFDVDGVQIDLSAVAKGYGVDQAAAALTQAGAVNYMVEVGGEVRVSGEKEPGRPWTIGVELPDLHRQRLYGKLPLKDAALATSGDYRNYRELKGEILSHTIDPRTGKPTPHLTASVSVVRPTAAEADALATALGVLTPDEALALAEEQKWAVMLLIHQPKAADGSDPPLLRRSSTAFNALGFEVVLGK